MSEEQTENADGPADTVEPEPVADVAASDVAASDVAEEEEILVDSEAEVVEPETEQDPLTVAEGEVARLRDQLLRTAADFDNYRKRSRREIREAEQRGREEFLRDLLPVFDNLDRAVQIAETASDVKSLSDGVTMVLRQFHDTLEKLGVERVESLGKGFDPMVHEAIQQIESDDPPGTVVAEVQPGYRTGDRLIRAAMVAVAKPRSAETPDED